MDGLGVATTHKTLLYVILASLLGVVGTVWCTVYGLNKFRISACTKLPIPLGIQLNACIGLDVW